jgi:methylase of polypeptide subunit release factors
MTEYPLAHQSVKLDLKPTVFQPTTTTRLLAQKMGDVRGKKVLDLGCGSGPIAIAAALEGASHVVAADVMDEACMLARNNAEINGVSDRVEVVQSNLFDGLKGRKFDVIVDDVSGMGDEVSRLSEWYPDPIPTGGIDGTMPTIKMLREAPEHLNSGGILLFPVITLSAHERIMEVAAEVFGNKLEKLATKRIPFSHELMKHIDRVQALKDQGLLSFTQMRSRYLWDLMVYRAEL